MPDQVHRCRNIVLDYCAAHTIEPPVGESAVRIHRNPFAIIG